MGTVRHAGASKSLLSTRREHEAGFRREGQLLMKFRDMLRAYLARVNGWSCLPSSQHSSPCKIWPAAAHMLGFGKTITHIR